MNAVPEGGHRGRRLAAGVSALVVTALSVWALSPWPRRLPPADVPQPPASDVVNASPPPLAVSTSRSPPPPVVPAAGRVLRGVVVRESDRSPVVGARVTAHAPANRWALPRRSTLTDSSGQFGISLGNGVWRLTASAVGLLPASHEVGVDAEGVDTEVELRLTQGSRVSGDVVDDTGAPVAGAHVVAVHRGNRLTSAATAGLLPVGPMAFCAAATSGPDGTFVAEGVPASGTVLLSARKDGWSALGARVDTVAAVGATDVRLVLRPTCRILVHVVDAADGSEVELYSLSYRVPPGWRELAQTPMEALRGEWDTPGIRSAELPGVRLYLGRFAPGPTGSGDVELALRFGAPGYEDLAVPVAVRAGELVEAKAQLRRTAAPQARVRFRAQVNGRPYAGDLAIGMRTRASPLPSTAWVRFEHGEAVRPVRLPAGPVMFTVSGAGPAGTWWKPAGAPVNVEIARSTSDADVVPVDLALAGALIDLSVVGPGGEPCAFYDLQVLDEAGVGTLFQDWSAIPTAAAVGEDVASTGPKLTSPIWVGPTARALRVSAAGIGGGTVTLPSVPADSAAIPVEVTLVEGQETDYAAQLRIFEGVPIQDQK